MPHEEKNMKETQVLGFQWQSRVVLQRQRLKGLRHQIDSESIGRQVVMRARSYGSKTFVPLISRPRVIKKKKKKKVVISIAASQRR